MQPSVKMESQHKQRRGALSSSFRKVLTAGLALLTIVSLWLATSQVSVQWNEATSNAATALGVHFTEALLSEMNQLALVAQRYSAAGQDPAFSFRKQAKTLFNATNHWTQVFWLDPSNHVHASFASEFSPLKDLHAIPHEHEAKLDVLKHFSKPILLPYREALTGEDEIWIYLPLSSGIQLNGFVGGVISVPNLLRSLTANELTPPSEIDLYKRGFKVGTFGEMTSAPRGLRFTRSLSDLGDNWSIQFQFPLKSPQELKRIHFLAGIEILCFVLWLLTFQSKESNFFTFIRSLFSKKEKLSPLAYYRTACALANEMVTLQLQPPSPSSEIVDTISLKPLLEESLEQLVPLLRAKQMKIDLRFYKGVPRTLKGLKEPLVQALRITVSEAIRVATGDTLSLTVSVVQRTSLEVVLLFEAACLSETSLEDVKRTQELMQSLLASLHGKWRADHLAGQACFMFTGTWRLKQKLPAQIPNKKQGTGVALLVGESLEKTEVLKEHLERRGWQTLFASQLGRVTASSDSPYDLIFVDCDFEKGKEVQFKKALLGLSKKSYLPIVALKTELSCGRRNQLLKWGATRVLNKPLKDADLDEILKGYQAPNVLSFPKRRAA